MLFALNLFPGFVMPNIHHAFLILCILGTISVIESTEADFLDSDFSVASPQKSNLNEKITKGILRQVFKKSQQNCVKRQELEKKLAKAGKVIKLKSRKTDSSLIRSFKTDPKIHQLELAHLPFEDATDQLNEMFNFSRHTIINELPVFDVKDGLGGQNQAQCRQEIGTATCNANSKYRTINGECNNLQNPRWGSATNCQPRLLPANYVGTSGFRVSVNGGPLPEPRQLSLNVHYNYNRPTNYVNHMYMFFGQLLDHDITQTPQSTTIDNQAIECCPAEDETHPQCAPIRISQNDPFYSQFNITCMNFVRSVICPTCTLGSRQVMNQVTSFIDGSFVYGNSENETSSLRTNDGTGRLRIQRSAYGDLLPTSSDPNNDLCSFPETNDICFEAGDSRANQHTVLTSLHTIFLREHNRLASALRQLNPQWNGEQLFQEARRILGATMQVITYKEYLPITLGNERMSYFNLWLGRDRTRTRYDPQEDPTTMVEFTTAAFRFGHSLINSIVANRPLNASNELRFLRDEFFQPFELRNGLINPIVAGASDSPAQWFDRHLVPDVTNFLYRIRGDQTGMDLASININRGRDHGIPTYVDAVRHCSGGNIIIRNFNDLVRRGLMQPEQERVLRQNYRSVQDIDLWPGILCEIYKEGAVVGPTAACIIGLQFRKLKYGDRFYFEHSNQRGSFTYQQLQEIRKVALSHIICLNTGIPRLPSNAMLFRSNSNPYIECRYVKGINLSYWKE